MDAELQWVDADDDGELDAVGEVWAEEDGGKAGLPAEGEQEEEDEGAGAVAEDAYLVPVEASDDEDPADALRAAFEELPAGDAVMETDANAEQKGAAESPKPGNEDVPEGAEAEVAVDLIIDDEEEEEEAAAAKTCEAEDKPNAQATNTATVAAATVADEPAREGNRKGQGKEKGKGKGKGKGYGKNDRNRGEHAGLVYQLVPTTKTLLIKSWKVVEEFGHEAVIPAWNNPAGAAVGDRISFDLEEMVQEGDGEPKPMATNVFVRGQVDEATKANLIKAAPPPTDVRSQVLYYLSDENLATDKFFHNIITETEGGWVSVSSILGCRRIKQLGASTKSVLEAVRNSPGIEVRDTTGQEAVRRTTPPPPLKGSAGVPAPRKSPPPPQQATPPEEASTVTVSVSNSECFYAGLVANQTKTQPYKFFIKCEAVTEQFGRDACFLPNQKPPNVEVGSLVAFTVSAEAGTGRPPQAGFVAELAPLGAAVLRGAGDSPGPGAQWGRKRTWDGSSK